MKVSELVEKVGKVKSENMKSNMLKELLKVKEYVSVIEKINLANVVVKVATHDHDSEGKELGFKINSCTKYIFHVMGMIELYTNLEIDRKNVFNEYDELSKTGLLNEITGLIGKDEIEECHAYLEMVWGDALQNYFTPAAFIKEQVERFGTLAGVTLSPIFEQATKALENLDDEKVKQITDAIGKLRK